MKFHLVQPQDVIYLWPEIKPLINKVLEHSNAEADAEVFFLPIYQDQQQLWIGLDSDKKGEIPCVLITEVLQYPLKTSMFVHVWATASGHDYTPWVEAFEEVKDFARVNSCEFVEARARKGLAKKLVKESGWKEHQIIVTTEL